MRYLLYLFTFILIPLNLFSQGDEKRLALVLGNSNYDNGELTNSTLDSRKVKLTLEKVGFEVLYYENLENKESTKNAFEIFYDKTDSFDVSLIYYAGHYSKLQ